MDQSPTVPVTGAKKYAPGLCSLSHLLIFGGVYIYLRLYRRFFIAIGLAVLAALLPFSTQLEGLLLIGAMADTYRQAKGINDGTVKQEPFDNRKHVGGSLLLIVLIIVSLAFRGSFVAW